MQRLTIPVTYEEAEKWLFSLPRFAVSGVDAYQPGLQRIDALLTAMDRPHDSYPSILVAGTNGKGTVASMIAAIATASGRRTGLHTSPHLLTFGERMRVNGLPADKRWLQKSISDFADVFRDVGASFFEASVALSLLYFATQEVDLAIVEVGLGGRLDATNILDPELSIITGIDFDHTEILGAELTDIAREKAGIMRRGKPVLTGARKPAVANVLGEVADQVGAEFHLLGAEIDIVTDSEGKSFIETLRDRYGPVLISLEGEHQIWHAAMAIRASELCSRLFLHSRSSVLTGLAATTEFSGLRGRMEKIATRPDIWVDVAHNPQSIKAALKTRTSGNPPVTDIFIGLQKDKDAETIARILALSGVRVTVLRMDLHRAADPLKLVRIFSENSVPVSLEINTTKDSISRWLSDGQPENSLLIMGSHIIVAEALNWDPNYFTKKRT